MFVIPLQGERLSHAVGCAFAICLEKKQQREKEKVTVTYNENGTSFTRMGSFRQTTLTERLADPQSAIVAGICYIVLARYTGISRYSITCPLARYTDILRYSRV